jgi:hypothetical protein
MRSGSLRTALPSLLLGGIVLLSLALRMWGSGFGLPAYTRYHPDEHALVERAAQILWPGPMPLTFYGEPPKAYGTRSCP